MFNKIQNIKWGSDPAKRGQTPLSNKGFTLVEVLVAITVFTLVTAVAVGLFIHALQSQRKVLAYQELFDQTSFIMEYMTRGIRMAKKQRTVTAPISCIATVGRNYELVGGSPSHLRFIRWDHLVGAFICYEFRVRENRLEVSRDRGVSWAFLTSPRLKVINFRFNIIGDGPETPPIQPIQPRVTIVLEVGGREYGAGLRPRIHLQTTVSQRDLDL
jgi:prepilin-type N-terminal cleavage/methylation domain-containing protein